MKQSDLALAMVRLGHDWTDVTVSQVERSKRKVSVDELFSLALALGYVVPDLLVPPETERLDFGVGVGFMRPGFVQRLMRGDIVMLQEWDEEGNPTEPRIQAKVGVQMDFDALRSAIELRARHR
jgi:hypothetical protein